MTSPYRRTLPSHPDLGQQKKQAKELLRAFRAGEAEARARIRQELPDRAAVGLSDAQFVIAREYGFRSWPELRQHIVATRPDERTAREQFREAIEDGDRDELRALLSADARVRALINEPMFSFDSPALVTVAGQGDVGLVDVLLEYGADPNAKSRWWAGGFHPLYAAKGVVAERLLEAGAVPDACAAAQIDRIDLLREMLEADPSRVNERGGDGQTPLHFAQSRAVIDLLLEHGADRDARDVDHRSTPAQWMLNHRRGGGRYDLAAYLVEQGASTDIFLATALGLTDRVRTMLDRDPTLLDLRTTKGEYAEKSPSSYHIYMWTIGADRSPMQVATQFEQPGVLELMETYASPKQRLIRSLSDGDGAGAHHLLRDQPDLLDSLGIEGQRLLAEAGWLGNAKAVELMLDLGFDPLVPNERGASVLHTASWQGSAESVAAVLKHPKAGELINRTEPEFGATPIGWCCHGSRYGPRGDHADIARLLLEAGADGPGSRREMSEAVRAAIETWLAEHGS